MRPATLIAKLLKTAFFLLLLAQIVGCAASKPPVPVGEIPAARSISIEDEQYGHTVLSQLSEKFQLDYDHPRNDSVHKIVDRLTIAAKSDKDPWHVFVFKDSTVKNAAATRGNHIFIWTGMLDTTKNDDELAVVLAHEIGHVLAGHTDPDPNEEAKKILIQVGAMAAGIAVSQVASGYDIADLIGQLTESLTTEFGKGALLNPHSQEMEYEADHIGLVLMTVAKYDPEQGIAFWERAQLDPDFSSSMQFFSSHPPAEDRLQRLREVLPIAKLRAKGIQTSTPTTNNTPAAINTLDNKTLKNKDSDKNKVIAPQTNTAPNITTPNITVPRAQAPNEPSTSDLSSKPSIVKWRVITQKSVLYEKASTNSRKIGEFVEGAIVEVVNLHGAWLEIDRPDHGFLLKQQLTPEW